MTDYYATLEVEETASYEEVKQAYRRLAMRWHPDKNDGSKESVEMFQLLSMAWETLSDDYLRSIYDTSRALSGKTSLRPSGPAPQTKPKRAMWTRIQKWERWLKAQDAKLEPLEKQWKKVTSNIKVLKQKLDTIAKLSDSPQSWVWLEGQPIETSSLDTVKAETQKAILAEREKLLELDTKISALEDEKESRKMAEQAKWEEDLKRIAVLGQAERDKILKEKLEHMARKPRCLHSCSWNHLRGDFNCRRCENRAEHFAFECNECALLVCAACMMALTGYEHYDY